MTPKAVIVGLPGTGKSTTGRRLAKMLAVPFADSDQLVETADGRSVRQIFAADGEAEFRRLEAEAIGLALSGFDGVLALGGGALTTEATARRLAECGVPVIALDASVPTLLGRVGDGTTRPLLAGDPSARLTTLAAERQPSYRALATFSVETDGRTPGQIAAHIAARLHDLARQ
jgi:shikimate kinase